MRVEFKIPDLGESIDSGDVVKLLVNVGDEVQPEQALMELETGKAVVEVPADTGGRVAEILVAEGDHVSVGQAVIALETDGKASPADTAPKAQAPAPVAQPAEQKPASAPPATQPPVPAVAGTPNGSASAGVVAPPPAAGTTTTGSETAAAVAPSPAAGTTTTGSETPAVAAPPSPDAGTTTTGSETAATVAPSPDAGTVTTGSEITGALAVHAAPNVKRIARELGVDLAKVKGSGKDGYISEDDVRQAAQKQAAPPPTAAPVFHSTLGTQALPDFSRYGHIERKPMTSVRLATAQHMTLAWTTIPAVTQYDSADITELNILRKRYGSNVEAAGGKLTVTAVLVKVVASALRQFPHFNASVDMAAREIIQKDYVNVGVAVNTERGLLVPVIRDADRKNIMELSVELARATEKVHKREVKPADLEGGTFSLTNLGTIGGTHFTPIINWPEVAILGISRAANEPVWRNETFEPRLMLPLSLSYDHRVIDGADGARFLRWICEALEQPFFLALEG